MMTFEEVVAGIEGLEAGDLRHWVEVSWVKPLREGEVFHFGEIDYARVRFLCDMHYDLGVDETALEILLGLLDQVYDLRRQVKVMGQVIEAQPEEVRRAIAVAVAGRGHSGG